MPDIIDIVRDFLNASDYDGLYSEMECACEKSDLAPCGEIQQECAAGYKQPCIHGGEHDWDIGPNKPSEVTE